MCTVTVVPRDGAGGYRLVANRDERHTRSNATAPVWIQQGSRRVAYPIDPDGGGTWVGVNDTGLAMALLNRYPVGAHQHPQAPSRGLIIPALLGCRRVSDAIRLIRAFDCWRFNAFTLIVVNRREVGVLTHDGRFDSVVLGPLSEPLLQTSSSLGDDLAESPRRQLFEELVLNETRPSRLLGQHVFHRLQWTSRPEISVLMERSDARTVSRTTIDVTKESIAIVYEPIDGLSASPTSWMRATECAA